MLEPLHSAYLGQLWKEKRGDLTHKSLNFKNADGALYIQQLEQLTKKLEKQKFCLSNIKNVNQNLLYSTLS